MHSPLLTDVSLALSVTASKVALSALAVIPQLACIIKLVISDVMYTCASGLGLLAACLITASMHA